MSMREDNRDRSRSVNWYNSRHFIYPTLQRDILTSCRLWASATMWLIWVTSSQKTKGCRDNWECETATASSYEGGGNISSWAQPGYLHRGWKWKAACSSLNIWQEKQDNCSVQVSPGQDVSYAFTWRRTPNQACTQMEANSLFLGLFQLFPSNSEKWKELCVLAEYVSKSSSCFVWTRIKRSRGEVKIKRDAKFSGSTPWHYNDELK